MFRRLKRAWKFIREDRTSTPIPAQQATVRSSVVGWQGHTAVMLQIQTEQFSTALILPAEHAMNLARGISDTARMAMETIAE